MTSKQVQSPVTSVVTRYAPEVEISPHALSSVTAGGAVVVNERLPKLSLVSPRERTVT